MSWLELEARLAARDFLVELRLEPGEVLAVIGPNGAGKSTLLEIIAGLLPADRGRLQIADRDLWKEPPHRRRIASLTQKAMLFPHLGVRGNVEFALRSHGVRRAEARRRAEDFLALVGVGELADRRPQQVSGGQAQRVAIARALAAEPDLLLLDEPLAALDVDVAQGIRQVLRDLLGDQHLLGNQRRTAAVVVTHDLLDVLALADRVVVLTDGRVVEEGSVHDVLSTPRSAFAARLAGVNLVAGVRREAGLWVVPGGASGQDAAEPTRSEVRGPEQGCVVVGVGGDALPVGDPAVALFRPEAVAIHLEPVHGSPRNSWCVHVQAFEAVAQGVRVRARHEQLGEIAADITAAAAAELSLEIGQRCWFSVKATQVQLVAGQP